MKENDFERKFLVNTMPAFEKSSEDHTEKITRAYLQVEPKYIRVDKTEASYGVGHMKSAYSLYVGHAKLSISVDSYEALIAEADNKIMTIWRRYFKSGPVMITVDIAGESMSFVKIHFDSQEEADSYQPDFQYLTEATGVPDLGTNAGIWMHCYGK